MHVCCSALCGYTHQLISPCPLHKHATHASSPARSQAHTATTHHSICSPCAVTVSHMPVTSAQHSLGLMCTGSMHLHQLCAPDTQLCKSYPAACLAHIVLHIVDANAGKEAQPANVWYWPCNEPRPELRVGIAGHRRSRNHGSNLKAHLVTTSLLWCVVGVGQAAVKPRATPPQHGIAQKWGHVNATSQPETNTKSAHQHSPALGRQHAMKHRLHSAAQGMQCSNT